MPDVKDHNTFILRVKQSKKSKHIFRVEQSTLLGLLDPVDKSIMILQNIGYYSASDPAPHPKRFKSPATLLCRPHISHDIHITPSLFTFLPILFKNITDLMLRIGPIFTEMWLTCNDILPKPACGNSWWQGKPETCCWTADRCKRKGAS